MLLVQMHRTMKTVKITLSTGVEITQDRNGNIKSLKSPYMDDLIFESPTTDTLFKRSLKQQLNSLFTF